jgi:hypothetical protein
MNLTDEAKKILNFYAFYRLDTHLYLSRDTEAIDMLFESVVDAINDCGPLKLQLPYNEFVRPSREFAAGDPGWVGHFEERDNRKFFLSDVYDYLTLFFRVKKAS